MTKKKLFYHIDQFLPRSVALLPYKLAFHDLAAQIKAIKGVEVWYRNSCLRKNLVFGISDLDITIFISTNNSSQMNIIKNILSKSKKKYPCLGEANFYIQDQYYIFSPSLNSYERARDPTLAAKLPPVQDNGKLDKIVFLLRMLYADREMLLSFHMARQKKWKIHFLDLGIESQNIITFETIIEVICSMFEIENEKIQNEIKESLLFIFSEKFSEDSIYHTEMPSIWKFLYPHRYLWFVGNRTEDISSASFTTLKNVCLRQIDWEVWGIMSQLPYINNGQEGIEIHLNRCMKICDTLGDQSGINIRLQKLIELSENFFQLE